MSFPHTFGGLPSPVPLAYLDDNFNALSASTGGGLIGYLYPATGAALRTLGSRLDDLATVMDFGAVGNGTADDTGAFVNALASFSGSGSLYVPPGTYKITSTITIPERVKVFGAGRFSTTLLFVPSANDTLLEVSNGASMIDQAYLGDMALTSSDTTHTKIALNIIDGNAIVVERIAILGTTTVGGTYTWTGANSIGIKLNGRQLLQFRDIDVSADKPWSIAANPHNIISLDHCNFHNIYATANGNPVWSVDFGASDDAYISNSHWTGAQAWVRGTHGFYWNDGSASTTSSYALTFFGIRTEQGEADNNYMIYIAPPAAHPVYGISIKGAYGGTETTGHERRGFYFRNAKAIKLDNIIYTSASAESLNIDSTVVGVRASECFWQAGSTATLSGQRYVDASPFDPNTGALSPSFTLDASANTKATKFSEVAHSSPSITLADGAETSILGANAVGTLSVHTNNGAAFSAVIAGGSFSTTTTLGSWSTTYNNAGTMNVCYNGGVYKIQNKTGSSRNVRWDLAGSLETF